MPSPSILAASSVVTFIATRQPERAKAFYRDTLGLRFVSEDRFAVVFDLNGVSLRVTHASEFTPAKFTVLGWQVREIAAAVSELQTRGVAFERFGDFMQQDELGIWTAPDGAKVAWFKDPDGNTLSISQH